MTETDATRLAAAARALEETKAAQRAMIAQMRAKLNALETALGDPTPVSPFAPLDPPAPPDVAGARMATAASGSRYQGRDDVLLARLDLAPGRGALAGVFTRSGARSAPVLWCEARLADIQRRGVGDAPLALLVNAGNANAFTGAAGVEAVSICAEAAGAALGLGADRVMIASTGVIGEPLEHDRIAAALTDLAAALDEGDAPRRWRDAAAAIMTTDTYPKFAGRRVGETGIAISGVAKGSGMIAPDMATMLAFVFTDAAVAPPLLQEVLVELNGASFNAITVDGDTSTSDTLLLAATGQADAPLIDSPDAPGYADFRDALGEVVRDLALQVVRDGEGISKCVRVRVSGAETQAAARRVALSIANSPLVKTAWAGEDPNWGRLIMAVGKSGEAVDRDRLRIDYGPHRIAENGQRAASYDEDTVAAYMTQPELEISVDLGVGSAGDAVWTTDLTHGYISINADYRS